MVDRVAAVASDQAREEAAELLRETAEEGYAENAPGVAIKQAETPYSVLA